MLSLLKVVCLEEHNDRFGCADAGTDLDLNVRRIKLRSTITVRGNIVPLNICMESRNGRDVVPATFVTSVVYQYHTYGVLTPVNH